MNEVEEIVRDITRCYSYHLSDACIKALVKNIEAHYAEAVEKAWCYDEVSK